MLGLVVLFFLGLWVLITLGATLLGRKLGRKFFNKKGGTKGAIIGFMLTMGGWLIYWAGEYYITQSRITQLCEDDSGLTIYISPEEYRERLINNNWEDAPRINLITDNKALFQNEEYENNHDSDSTINIFSRRIFYDGFFISKRLFVDSEHRVVLTRFSSIHLIQANDFSDIRFWRSNIKDCNGNHLNQYRNQLFLNYQGVTNE